VCSNIWLLWSVFLLDFLSLDSLPIYGKKWRRSVLKSEGHGHWGQASKLNADRNSFSISAPKMGYLVIFAFFVFGRKWIIFFILFFVFVPKMSFALCRKCYVRKWTVTKFCEIGTGDFRFPPKVEFRFHRHFRLRPKMKNASSVGLYIKLFQITPDVNDFQTLNNPGSGQPVGALKN